MKAFSNPLVWNRDYFGNHNGKPTRTGKLNKPHYTDDSHPMKIQPVNYRQAHSSLATPSSDGMTNGPKRRGPALSRASRQSRLDQTHGRERREFDAFQEHISQLMQNRHKLEELNLPQTGGIKSHITVLVRQQAQERDELLATQALTLQLLKDRQTQEKADLLRE